MISNKRLSRLALLGGCAVLLAIPAIGQDAPESILPPGFGDPAPERPSKPSPAKPTGDLKLPADLLPDDQPTGGSSSSGNSVARPSQSSGSSLAAASATAKDDEEGDEEEEVPILPDLPPSARRSIDQVGVLGFDDGDMGPAAFGQADGRHLSALLQSINGPLVSRWGSIILRRALLSKATTPPEVNGADWVAERAWLLLKMGEADSARLLVQAVDADRFTPRLYDVGMQSALANADPAAMCGMVDGALVESEDKAWKLARAICAALSGESSQASAQIDSLRDRRAVRGVDILLAEKVVGAGSNSRRSVKIEWEDVPALTAWRYGLATATAVSIPDKLMAPLGPRVAAWQAKAPLLSYAERLRGAETAAALGVYSSAALVDHYAAMADAEDTPDAVQGTTEALRQCYAAGSASARVSAMRTLWDAPDIGTLRSYARLVLTAQAAARLPVTEAVSADVDRLIASMLTAGHDLAAARWASVAQAASGDTAERALALLAVGTPKGITGFDAGDVSGFSGKSDNASKLLFAGMAGLGRLSNEDIESLAEDLEVPIGRASSWTQLLDRAVAAGEKGTVAVLVGASLQTSDWSKVRPEYFYRAIYALRQVGLEPEARMLAAEAVART